MLGSIHVSSPGSILNPTPFMIGFSRPGRWRPPSSPRNVIGYESYQARRAAGSTQDHASCTGQTSRREACTGRVYLYSQRESIYLVGEGRPIEWKHVGPEKLSCPTRPKLFKDRPSIPPLPTKNVHATQHHGHAFLGTAFLFAAALCFATCETPGGRCRGGGGCCSGAGCSCGRSR